MTTPAVPASGAGELLLLTKHFPFNRGDTPAESYLETEIVALGRAFRRILVVATEAEPRRSVSTPLPDNVQAVAIGVASDVRAKLRLALEGLALPVLGEVLEKEVLDSEARLTPRRRLFQTYFIEKAHRKWVALEGVLETRGFVPSHLYSFWLYDTALVAAWGAQRYPGSFAFARGHGFDLYAHRSPVDYLPARRYILSRLDLVLPCSEHGTEYLRRSFGGTTRAAIKTSYLGTQDLPDQSAERRSGPFRIVSCSRMVPLKRVPLLAEAMAILGRRGLDITWMHFGDGPDMARIRELVRGSDHLRADLRGNVPNAEVLREYTSSHFDLFVNVSQQEGLPISIMEAAGFGVPALATDVGGTAEIVRSGTSGWLLPAEVTPEVLAHTIESIVDLGDEDLAAMRRGARSVWLRHFRAADNIEGLLRMIKQGADHA